MKRRLRADLILLVAFLTIFLGYLGLGYGIALWYHGALPTAEDLGNRFLYVEKVKAFVGLWVFQIGMYAALAGLALWLAARIRFRKPTAEPKADASALPDDTSWAGLGLLFLVLVGVLAYVCSPTPRPPEGVRLLQPAATQGKVTRPPEATTVRPVR